MIVNPIDPEGFTSPMPREVVDVANASIRQEMPQLETKGPMRSAMPISDMVEPDPALSVYSGQSYQQQQAYFDTARRIEIGAVGIGGRDQGTLSPPYDVTILRATETLIRISEDGWRGVLPYKPYVYHNFMWRQPEEHISIIW